MNIHNSSPRKIKCVRNDRDVIGSKEHNHLLEVGKTYSLEDVDVHGWHTEVYLKEFPGKSFNSVLFVEQRPVADQRKPYDPPTAEIMPITNADGCGCGNKIKTHFAKIIVSSATEKPYYDILYFDPADRTYHIGFGSYYLEYVRKWLAEEFEIIEDNHAPDIVEVLRCMACRHWKKDVAGCTDFVGRCSLANYMVGATGFCVYGERKEAAHSIPVNDLYDEEGGDLNG